MAGLGKEVVLRMVPPDSTVLIESDDPFIGQLLVDPQLRHPLDNEKEDACRYLFKLCKRLDDDYLEKRGITLMFDVDGGTLPGPACRTAGLIVAVLVIDITGRSRVRPTTGTITVKMHRRGTMWACSVSDSGIYAVRSHPSNPPPIVRQLARRLNARLVHEPAEDGATTAFMFEPIS
jgi:hypothetical protein